MWVREKMNLLAHTIVHLFWFTGGMPKLGMWCVFDGDEGRVRVRAPGMHTDLPARAGRSKV